MTGKVVLIVASHPDDEVLGVGGTTCAHAAAGDTVEILIVAEGITSRHPEETPKIVKSQLAELQNAAEKAAQTLGTNKPRFLGLPDQRLDTLPFLDIVWSIETIVSDVRPEIVYTHHANDLNRDHRIVHDAVLTACRPLPDSSVNLIRCFETLSSTDWMNPNSHPNFIPTDFVDITKQLEKNLSSGGNAGLMIFLLWGSLVLVGLFLSVHSRDINPSQNVLQGRWSNIILLWEKEGYFVHGGLWFSKPLIEDPTQTIIPPYTMGFLQGAHLLEKIHIGLLQQYYYL